MWTPETPPTAPLSATRSVPWRSPTGLRGLKKLARHQSIGRKSGGERRETAKLQAQRKHVVDQPDMRRNRAGARGFAPLALSTGYLNKEIAGLGAGGSCYTVRTVQGGIPMTVEEMPAGLRLRRFMFEARL